MIAVYAAIGSALILAEPGAVALAASLPAYALVEYAVHRWILHGPWDAVTAYRVHGAHHADPEDVGHIGVPPALVATTFLAIAIATRGVLGWFPSSFMGGLLVQFAVFELVHRGLHGHGTIARWLPRRLRAHHAAHHARDPGAAHGVTPMSAVVDRLFGTMPGPTWPYRVVSGALPVAGRVSATSAKEAARRAAGEILQAPSEARITITIADETFEIASYGSRSEIVRPKNGAQTP